MGTVSLKDRKAIARGCLASSTSLAEVAAQLGHPSYRAFATWCRRQFGVSPRELREGEPGKGRSPAAETASTTYQARCTQAERETIGEAIAVLVARDGGTHGAALARALAYAAKHPAKHGSDR